MFKNFARVAGGANPRKKLSERLRHRFMKKFWRIPINYGFLGCTGCGRCIDACTGKIDVREVLKSLAEVK
jgi:ferredoxin